MFAAVIACTQTDIKRVLAYSTISQIAFMMFALGVSGWGEGKDEGFTASMFHLFTHAFFKALLFLGAGAVIHAVHSNEMKDMGGLRKSLPITHITFLLACLAIAGVPPFAGFFSKEAILSAAYQNNLPIFYVGVLTSGLTAFYMFRLYFRIFWNKPAVHQAGHSHESHTWAMNIPLIILATGAVFAGLIPFGSFVSAQGNAVVLPFNLMFSVGPVLVGLLGITIAYVLYGKKSELPAKISDSVSLLYKSAYHKFYIDEIYLFVTKRILFNLIGRPSAWFDKNVVNGIMINGSATSTVMLSGAIKKMQSGRLQTYAMFFLGGVLILAALLVIKFI
jgi:NADH-quinone oxidoreductase subunit L